MTDLKANIDLGPIRPPSEALSLLLRVTRNCPWNKCTFCPVYKGEKFERRSEEAVISDIDSIVGCVETIRGISEERGLDGEVTAELLHEIFRYMDADEGFKRVALWMNRGSRTVFLQDADSLCIRPERMKRIVRHLRKRLPLIERVTTYARSKTLASRSLEDLAELNEAGIDRIHMGIESGSDSVLELVRKGATSQTHVDAGRKVMEAGFEVCCYVMPGLGGRKYSREHAAETARVLRLVNPHHIRIRSLVIIPSSPLEEMFNSGEFEPLSEREVIKEIRDMLAGLTDMQGYVVSDHDWNLLMEIEGDLSGGPDAVLSIVDRFLAMSEEDQEKFVFARRRGLVWRMDQLPLSVRE